MMDFDLARVAAAMGRAQRAWEEADAHLQNADAEAWQGAAAETARDQVVQARTDGIAIGCQLDEAARALQQALGEIALLRLGHGGS